MVPEDVTDAELAQPNYEYNRDDIFQNKIGDPLQLTDEQLEVNLDLLREHAHFDEDDLDKAREEFSNGADCLYKILLILLCPRLDSFKHVNINDPVIRRSRDRYVELIQLAQILQYGKTF